MSGDPEGELAALLPRLIRDSRVHSIDNLRSALIALVIFHHAALPFGGIGFWPYMSPYHGTNSSVVLTLFVLLNQSYFMGTLFFIAGHFSAWAASNRTWQKFCADKLKRLGIPAVVYTLFVQPLNIVLVQSAKHSPILPALGTYYANLNGVRGPVWFIAVLLLFDLVYIVVRTCLPPLSFLVPSSATQYRATAVVGIACVIVCSFLIRISHPIGRESWPPFQLPLAYASQYVFAYAAGTSLSKIQQYLLVSHPAGRLALAYLLAILSISLVGAVAHMTHHESLFVGGANPFAFFLAAWNEICFYFIGTALYSLFHDSEHTTRRWGNTARYSYGAFLLHAPVVVALQILVDGSMPTVPGVVKTLVVGALGVCISWAGAWLLIRIPGVAKVV